MARYAWRWIDDHPATDGLSLEELDAIAPKCDAIMRRVRQIGEQREYQSFARDEYDDRDEEPGDDVVRRAARRAEDAELESLYDALHELGAREERPYEHHNELEHYCAMMEA